MSCIEESERAVSTEEVPKAISGAVSDECTGVAERADERACRNHKSEPSPKRVPRKRSEPCVPSCTESRERAALPECTVGSESTGNGERASERAAFRECTGEDE
jgi:hypothetical protein